MFSNIFASVSWRINLQDKLKHLKKTTGLYSIVAKSWSVVFLVVGLLFLAIPAELGGNLTSLAHALGLNGEISAPAGNLWHVLSLSLMGALVLLAGTSARYPELKAPYVTLLVAKTISVIGFLALSRIIGSAWLLCAVADAFVAFTLFITYPSGVVKGLVKEFARILPVKPPHYEIWFGKIDIAPGKALWFRYTILNGIKKEASTWAILFDSGKITTGKQTWSLSNLAPSNCVIIPNNKNTQRFQDIPQVFHLGSAHLDGANAIGQAGDISWDLEFKDNGHRFEHVPTLIKLLRVAKSTYSGCFLDLRFSGTIKNGSEVITLQDRPGMIGHIHGKKSAHSWAWAHCNNFEGHDNVIFEGLSARIKLGGKVTSPLSSFILIAGERRYEFSSSVTLFTAQSDFGEGKWEFMVKSSTATLKGTAVAPGKVALVEYTDTDDSNLWCYNSKLASLKLELTDLKTNKVEVFETKETAAFEIVNREIPSREVEL